ncbi:MAG TPA: RNA pseudouridine synthase, partial [Geminicoccaceae bacterium]|nr:RNA pseudouridine synthase [Geminicoccaceae bacterium]
IDKPAGVPVHAGPGGGVNLEQYFEALRFGMPQPPALAHRLDRDTSGCLVLGRHRKALARLGRLFAGGQVEKVYWAVVRGRPPAPAGRIELALNKRSERRGWWVEADPEGQSAVTDYHLLGEGGGIAWLECRPRTGRTHQVRVHCAELGCPVLGDPIYGGGAAPGDDAPLHLHARAVGLPLYPNRPPVEVVAPSPPHMLEALRRCGYGGGEEPASPAARKEADVRHRPGNTRPSGD